MSHVITRMCSCAALVVAVLSLPASSAMADEYSVDFCKDWTSDAPTAVFPGVSAFGAYGVEANCYLGGTAGGLHQGQPGGRMGYDTVAGIRLSVPADRPGLRIDRALTAHSMQSSSGSLPFLRFFGGSTLLDNNPGGQARHDDRVLPTGTRTLEWSIYCSYSAGATPCQWDAPDDMLHVYKARLFLNESDAPALSITGGTLLAGGDQAHKRTVGFETSDPDSGVSDVIITLDDVVAGSVRYACAGNDWSACPRARSAQTVTVDTSSVPDGTYHVTVIARDAANNATARSAGAVTIVNGGAQQPPASLPVGMPGAGSGAASTANGTPASRAARLTLSYARGGGRDGAARLAYEAGLAVRGRLVDEHGRSIARAAIAVLSRQRRAGAVRERVATVLSDLDGRFQYRLPPGPSRTVSFSYAAFGGEKPVAQASLRTSVRASVIAAKFSPSAPRPRERVSFTGRLGHLPRSGVQIAIQFRDGRRWRTIGLTSTKAKGRFVWFYRFLRSVPGDRFEFRAHVSSPIYPFAVGNSRTVRVRIGR